MRAALFSHSAAQRSRRLIFAATPAASTSTRELRVREDGAKPSPPRDCKAAPTAREPLSGQVSKGQPDGKAARSRPPSQETGGVCSPRIRLASNRVAGQPSPPARDGRGGTHAQPTLWQCSYPSASVLAVSLRPADCFCDLRHFGLSPQHTRKHAATMQGIITDPSDAAVAGAAINVAGHPFCRRQTPRANRVFRHDGRFHFDVPAGRYRLTITHAVAASFRAGC